MPDLRKNPFIVPLEEQEVQNLFPAEHLEISHLQFLLNSEISADEKLELLTRAQLEYMQQYFSFRTEYLQLLPNMSEIEADEKRMQHFDWVRGGMETNADILLFIERKLLGLPHTPPEEQSSVKSLKTKRKRHTEPPQLTPNQTLLFFNILRHFKIITSTAETAGFCIEQLTGYGAEYARKNIANPDFNREDVAKVLETLNQITARLNQAL